MSRDPLTESDLRHEVGSRLRLERQAKGLSLRAASQLADLAPSYLRAVERGESTPSLPVLVKLVAAYGSSMNRLLATIGTPPPVVGRLDDSPGWREISEPRLDMRIYQVVLAGGARTTARLTAEGDVLIYVLSGAVALEQPPPPAVLARGDAVKIRHSKTVAWATSGAGASRIVIGIGPSARLDEVMSSAQIANPP